MYLVVAPSLQSIFVVLQCLEYVQLKNRVALLEMSFFNQQKHASQKFQLTNRKATAIISHLD